MENFVLPEVSGRKVCVTGASGFIGRHLTRQLVASGAQVTAILRTRHAQRTLEALGADTRVVGGGGDAALQEAMSGQDVLANLAYDMRGSGAENLEAFDAILSGAIAAGIGRFVQMSSIVVYDDWPTGTVDSGSQISLGVGTGYRQTKAEIEKRLLASELSAIILQPTIVYGPGSALWTKRPISMLKGGGVVLPDPVGQCTGVYVDDVSQAVLRAIAAGPVTQERFPISGADDVSWYAFFVAYSKMIEAGSVELVPYQDLLDRLGPENPTGASKGPSVSARISAKLRGVVGNDRFETVVENARRLKGGKKLAYPDRSSLALFSATPQVSIDHARAELQFEPRFSFSDGIRAVQESPG